MKAAAVCDQYVTTIFPRTPEWKIPKNFTPKLRELQKVIGEIHGAFREQQYCQTGAKFSAGNIQHTRVALQKRLMVVRRAARALDGEIPGLAAMCKVPTIKSSHAAWHEASRTILDGIAPHFEALVDDGVPDDTLLRIQQADADFAHAVAEAADIRRRRTAAVRRLPALITRGHALLASLGVTMLAYRETYPEHDGAANIWEHVKHVQRDPRRRPRRLVPVLGLPPD